jgi:hypothetical protein
MIFTYLPRPGSAVLAIMCIVSMAQPAGVIGSTEVRGETETAVSRVQSVGATLDRQTKAKAKT